MIRSNTSSVAGVVEMIISRKPYLTEAMAVGIINISALARRIMPEVEAMYEQPVNQGAIVMALNRLLPTLKPRDHTQLRQLLANLGDIILRSNLCDYTFKNSDTLSSCHLRVLEQLNFLHEPNAFYTHVQGIFETNIVISESLAHYVEEYFAGEHSLFKKSGLSSVTIKLPQVNILQPGFYYSIMKELSWENINLIEVISSTNEFTVVVDNSLIDKTFTVLKNIGKSSVFF